VSGCNVGYIGQVMSRYCSGPKKSCFLALPMSWLYQNFRSGVIFALDIVGFSYKLLEEILSIWMSSVHILMLWKLAASAKFSFFSYLLRSSFKNLIGPLYGYLGMDGHLFRQNQNGVEWTNSYGSIGSKPVNLLSLFVSLFALACALTLYSEIGAIRFCSIFTIDVNIVLSG
jgi:hypothetical protein